jgi:hypothetical protein
VSIPELGLSLVGTVAGFDSDTSYGRGLQNIMSTPCSLALIRYGVHCCSGSVKGWYKGIRSVAKEGERRVLMIDLG